MPRGVKGSGKAAKKSAVKPVEEKKVAPVEKAGRKPYPPREERVKMAEKKIARLTKLNDARRALIEKTEATLNERKAVLLKSEAMLAKELNKKEKLTNPPAAKQKALGIRAAKKAEKEQYAALIKVLAEKGLTVDELLNKVTQE